jgi:hypothetical protein
MKPVRWLDFSEELKRLINSPKGNSRSIQRLLYIERIMWHVHQKLFPSLLDNITWIELEDDDADVDMVVPDQQGVMKFMDTVYETGKEMVTQLETFLLLDDELDRHVSSTKDIILKVNEKIQHVFVNSTVSRNDAVVAKYTQLVK